MKGAASVLSMVKMPLGSARNLVSYLRFRLKYPRTRFIRPGTQRTFFSQGGQDAFLSALLFPALMRDHNRGLVVIDIGCNHPTVFSNSLFFEAYFGCRTLAVDPLAEFQAEWRAERPAALFECCALGSVSGTGELIVPVSSRQRADPSMFASLHGDDARYKSMTVERRHIVVRRLSDVLDEHGIDEVLLCSIDVEGSELEVLRGLDFDRHRITCFCIENNARSRYGDAAIRDYLAERGYLFHARLGHLDDVFIHASYAQSLEAGPMTAEHGGDGDAASTGHCAGRRRNGGA